MADRYFGVLYLEQIDKHRLYCQENFNEPRLFLLLNQFEPAHLIRCPKQRKGHLDHYQLQLDYYQLVNNILIENSHLVKKSYNKLQFHRENYGLDIIQIMRANEYHNSRQIAVSYTHLTLPTKRIVQISVVAVFLKQKK
eukprot:TRINITY_DN11621_c0_g1_i1.p1 TRINITY_DN11621_c0_g1~~TRINITY_DN11621_c0_g1_i1.p1  ORF type:complete len:139 (-),score=13.36 TRINITY_DN11621_c0_g1_i1:67-483(-)